MQFTRALRHRNYKLFFSGQLVSLVGTWMQQVAEAWLVYRLTDSSALLGVAAFASQIPVFLFASVGGTVADRHNRHRIVIIDADPVDDPAAHPGGADAHRLRCASGTSSCWRPASDS